MRELSLFTGIGGGLLGTKLLGWTHIGYVENNEYCQRVIRQRIIDGYLDNAPIFGDIRAFIDRGYAASYTGMADVITAGFPCQPFSVAGKQFGERDERNMWPATIECIRIVRPKYAFLENVPGILSSGYFGRILGDLSSVGYDCRWGVVSAAQVGAAHRRKRLWIVAANTQSAGWKGILRNNAGRIIKEGKESHPQTDSLDQLRDLVSRIEKRLGEPGVFGIDDGLPHRVDRLAVIGNGQVPIVAATAWHLLGGE